MKPLFTVHAGEYLVGSFIEKKYPKVNVWIPAKDTGIDLLVTDANNTRTISIQVKFSKDFTPTHHTLLMQNKLSATGWWTHQETKINKSKADFWIFVLPSFTENRTHFIIIPPAELLRRLRAIHSKREKKIHSYLSVTKSAQCWETRGLKKKNKEMHTFDRSRQSVRDFTQFLDNWTDVEKQLKI